MELSALLSEMSGLAAEGDRTRYFGDPRYRWVIQRLWIAIGNETEFLSTPGQLPEPWRSIRRLRNELAHVSLPDINDHRVWRLTSTRPRELLHQLEQLPA